MLNADDSNLSNRSLFIHSNAANHVEALCGGFRWDMRRKPSDPAAEVKHDKAVTGIHSTGERSFLSCSLDGRLCLWDFNVGRKPTHVFSAPDHG